MKRIYNFNPGPAMLPETVLQQAQQELCNWHNTGMSPMEMSHRGKEFTEIREQTEQTLRELLKIPKNYHVLFLHGGATSQFAMVPMNLLGDKKKAAYINSGTWAKKALDEASRYAKIDVLASAEQRDGIFYLPEVNHLAVNGEHAYFYYTENETIAGMQFHQIPEVANVPIVSDMTSSILSKPLDINRFGLIYASAQKNLGHAGVTIVIVRDDCLKPALDFTPTMFQYQVHIENQSCYNTPPTYAWYFVGLMLQWIKSQGGVEAMERQCHQKANLLYDLLDNSHFYRSPIAKPHRSYLNVPFTLAKPELEKTFLEEAKQVDLAGLEGHRSVGGMRASLYLGMPLQGVQRLVEFMQDFAKKYEE